MQLYSILVITIIFPLAVRALMARLGLNELAYIMLFIYPLVATFSLIYITVIFITDYTSLK